MSYLNARIIDLVDMQAARAAVMHDLGIPFYQYPMHTLQELCKERGLNASSVARRLEMAAFESPMPTCEDLEAYGADIIIAYLQQTHAWFIRRKLPFMSSLIANIDERHFDSIELARDLKFVFPMFVEDFIKHIYEEEDTVFKQIMRLHRAVEERRPSVRLFFSMKRYSIGKFAHKHLDEDDELEGIRELTNNYAFTDSSSTHTKVIYQELKAFERVLQVHARVEDELLMPKALRLEQYASDLLRRWAKKN